MVADLGTKALAVAKLQELKKAMRMTEKMLSRKDKEKLEKRQGKV